MHKWEYMYLKAINNKVFMVNGQREEKYKGVSSNSVKAKILFEYLNELGSQGWEAVGFSSSEENFLQKKIVVLLKRPIP